MAELCDVYAYEDQGARIKTENIKGIFGVCVWLRSKESAHIEKVTF